MPTYFPNSTTHKHLKAIAKLLGGKLSAKFSGIIVHGNKVLYRHGQFAILKRKYNRWNWTKPFGSKRDRKLVRWVLLHVSRPSHSFFLVPVSKARRFSKIWESRLNMGIDPDLARGGRAKIWKYQMPLAEVKRILKK